MEGDAVNESESFPLDRNDFPPICNRNESILPTKKGAQRCGKKGKWQPKAREDQNTTPILEMESNDGNRGDGIQEERDIVLYPAGGAFNKLRKKQVFLEQLLIQHWAGYSITPTHLKKEYVEKHILRPIRESGRTLKIFQGSKPDDGFWWIPNADVAFDRLAQKLRDTKKTMVQMQGEGGTKTAPKRSARSRRKTPATTCTVDVAPPKKRRKITRSEKTSALLDKVPLTRLASSASSQVSYTSHEDTATKMKSRVKLPKSEITVVVPRPREAVRRNRTMNTATSKEKTTTDPPSASIKELQEVVWSQWEQIDCWRRLCARYKETNEVQRQVIRQQNAMLAQRGSSNECSL